MNNLFKNMTSEGLEESEDRLGGFQTLDSGIYRATIKALYGGQSASGAVSVTLIADIDGQEFRETFWVTNRKGENWFINKSSGKKSPLPGFTMVDELCLIATEKPLSEQEIEEKVINIYNYDEGRMVPTSVPMFVECLGKEVALGILKQLVNKREKQGDEYVDTPEFREENVVDKVFHPDLKVTVPEARKGKEPHFWDAWEKRNKGQVRDRRTIKDGQQAGNRSGPPTAASVQESKPRRSLFQK